MEEKYPGIDWHCDGCNSYLNEQVGFDDSCGDWKCTECGLDNFIDESEINWDDEVEGNDGIPEGCNACGGPYPNCCDSCPMFD